MRILFGENLIWRFFTIRQTAKLKFSLNFPAIRYNVVSGQGQSSTHIHSRHLSKGFTGGEWGRLQARDCAGWTGGVIRCELHALVEQEAVCSSEQESCVSSEAAVLGSV